MNDSPSKTPDEAALAARLRSAGVTPTRQRLAVARVLLSRPQHLSAEQLIGELKDTGCSGVSKATVYNTLGLFAQVGLIREVIADPSRVMYDSNVSEHHHLYDVDTGALVDIAPGAVKLGPLAGLPDDVEVAGVQVIVRVRRRR